MQRVREVFAAFLKLGLTSFGGPVAHIGYFRHEFVERRKWFDERTYVDLVALCQFLPGPASSQVGMAIGLSRAGYLGALAAWIAFTLPSTIALVLFAYGLLQYGSALGSGWLHGLKAAAVAVVAVAVLGMARTLTPDRERASIAVAAAVVALAVPTSWGQIGAIILGGIAGLIFLRSAETNEHASLPLSVTRPQAIVALIVFFVLLIGLPLLAAGTASQGIRMFGAFYRAGSLVFGGGHVVLPLLQAEVVPTGWIDNNTFLAGYGAAQAVPGPLFTFSAFLGTLMRSEPNGLIGALLCLTAIFIPSFLLIIGALPFWEALRRQHTAQSVMRGVNAAVVGLLLAALYNPVWIAGIGSAKDFALAITAFLFLYMWQAAPWLVVLGCAGGAALLFSL